MPLFAVVFVIGVLAGGVPAYKITSSFYQAKAARSLEAALEAQQTQLLEAYNAEKRALEANHAEEMKANVIVKEIVKTIPQTQKVKSDCSYTRGTVRLLNRAAGDSLPKTAALPAADHSAASDVTESDGIAYSLDLLKAYNLARNQCNALIGFLTRDEAHAD
jgi:hypothetical protein